MPDNKKKTFFLTVDGFLFEAEKWSVEEPELQPPARYLLKNVYLAKAVYDSDVGHPQFISFASEWVIPEVRLYRDKVIAKWDK